MILARNDVPGVDCRFGGSRAAQQLFDKVDDCRYLKYEYVARNYSEPLSEKELFTPGVKKGKMPYVFFLLDSLWTGWTSP